MDNFRTIIKGVRVFEENSFSSPKFVTLAGGTIASISDDDEGDDDEGADLYEDIIDGRGKFLVPGYIDCHVHIREKEELLQHAQHGVTTVLDMGCWPNELMNSFRNLPGYPDYLSAGPVAVHPHGLHSHAGETGLPQDCTVDTPEKAVQFVKNRLAENTDFIKIVCEDGCPIEPAMRIAYEARAAGRISIAHAPSIESFHNAAKLWTNIITHAPMDGIIDDDLCDKIAETGQVVVPTLIMMKMGIKKFNNAFMIFIMIFVSIKAMLFAGKGVREIFTSLYTKLMAGLDVHYSIESVRKMHAAGIPICTGTDSNTPPKSGGPCAVPHGSSFQAELELLEQAALSRLDILGAATSEPARHFRLPERGSVEVHKRADLVLLRRNPLLDIANFAAIEEVWCKGVKVAR